jgi:hypothetical protein
MFDVPNVVLKANQTVDSYLEKRAREIRNCWQADRGPTLDVYDTNHHLEFVAQQVWNVLSSRGLARLFSLSSQAPNRGCSPNYLLSKSELQFQTHPPERFISGQWRIRYRVSQGPGSARLGVTPLEMPVFP